MSFTRAGRTLSIAVLATALLPRVTHTAVAPEPHLWERIQYPPVPIPGAEHEHLDVLVSPETSRLRFDLMWTGADDAKLPKPIEDAATIRVRLHTADGAIVLPERNGRLGEWVGTTMSGSTTYSTTYDFPWGRNALDEAWIELDVAGGVFWVEMPYGFARNPADPETADPRRSKPEFPSSMKKLGDRDVLVPWLSVHYDLGEIQNGWKLFLDLRNPFDAQAEVVLYHWPPSPFWKLDSPRTAIDLEWGGKVHSGRGTAIRIHEDELERSDTFSLPRTGVSPGREWGTAVIHVEDKTYSCRIPSSLFKYIHGVTDPYNPKRLAVARGR